MQHDTLNSFIQIRSLDENKIQTKMKHKEQYQHNMNGKLSGSLSSDCKIPMKHNNYYKEVYIRLL